MSPPELEASSPITKADVVFTEATPEQRILCWELNGASWAPPMTIAQYVGRETALSETALSTNGGTKYFVLHPQNDATTIVSACEVTAKRALVTDNNTNTAREVAAYSIASVFTNPRFREHGMASHMLRQVQEVVDRTSECGALYSDIGRVYYTRLGWKDFRSPQVLLTVSEDLSVFFSPGVVLLTADGVATLCEQDVEAIKRRFQRLAASGDGKTHVAFLPTAEQMAWHFTRDGYVCKTLLGREVVHRGAKTEDGASWIYWDHDLREKKLKVLRVVTREEDGGEKQRGDVKKLLMAALAEAREWGLPKVLVWNPTTKVAEVTTGIWKDLGPKVQVTFEEREDGSIPSLRWKGDKGLEEVVWESNEYYAWC
ncbi:hypothetical protein CHGG_02037 [Chaetomium globosum CBS 148.51]|uniref:LYC1 C-terminal domain-containing protein n=1 Tax=Chaetomium globosum (strain ATCC 6205 / CBS 148.51 / DSM 1962 / NBRC 6347 / NRRL 1970) TaxID=306901 RepID=Q2HCL7_CHAGB|nr:uncharacterized protein CHGG_02037 [Chaetomium globosum CBS 148.51]EAQ93802.1 hypothetical protein CHGG_02037 [Chaetomium globosum CBS 148.51]